MSQSLSVVVRRGSYVDSVTLLQVTAEVAALPGVADAALVMGTDLNLGLLRESGLLGDDGAAAGPNDLVIAVRAVDDGAGAAAVQQAEAVVARRRLTTTDNSTAGVQPRSLRSGHRADPEAQLALISVPGAFAAAEARQALADGLHVFLFSDNVSLDDEIDLKRRAKQRGLLVMGPDCGTAILNGVGFGFANIVRRGSVGIVGASGTGIQELTCLLDRAGEGISHAIGTGSHDLHARVGAITTLQAIALLRDDPATQTIVLVSKAADAEVAAEVLRVLSATGKRAVAYLQGSQIATPSNVTLANNLEEAARLAAATWPEMQAGEAPPVRLNDGQREIRGLFCGGTLCQEAAATVGPGAAHQFIDFGDDQYTRGRAHPMIDPTLRNQAIVRAGADPRVGVILLDFILGLGSHPDPAGAALPAIREALEAARADGRELAVLAHVVGTERDPQDLASQAATLRAGGVCVLPSNYQAAVLASQLARRVAV